MDSTGSECPLLDQCHALCNCSCACRRPSVCYRCLDRPREEIHLSVSLSYHLVEDPIASYQEMLSVDFRLHTTHQASCRQSCICSLSNRWWKPHHSYTKWLTCRLWSFQDFYPYKVIPNQSGKASCSYSLWRNEHGIISSCRLWLLHCCLYLFQGLFLYTL